MTAHEELIERLIASRAADIERLYINAERAVGAGERDNWVSEARRAAADMPLLVALRSPETVARMEADKGLV